MPGLGRILVAASLALVVLGLLAMLFGRWLPLGHLPGDLNFQGRGWRVSVPLATSILVSVLLTLLLWVVSRLR